MKLRKNKPDVSSAPVSKRKATGEQAMSVKRWRDDSKSVSNLMASMTPGQTHQCPLFLKLRGRLTEFERGLHPPPPRPTHLVARKWRPGGRGAGPKVGESVACGAWEGTGHLAGSRPAGPCLPSSRPERDFAKCLRRSGGSNSSKKGHLVSAPG